MVIVYAFMIRSILVISMFYIGGSLYSKMCQYFTVVWGVFSLIVVMVFVYSSVLAVLTVIDGARHEVSYAFDTALGVRVLHQQPGSGQLLSLEGHHAAEAVVQA